MWACVLCTLVVNPWYSLHENVGELKSVVPDAHLFKAVFIPNSCMINESLLVWLALSWNVARQPTVHAVAGSEGKLGLRWCLNSNWLLALYNVGPLTTQIGKGAVSLNLTLRR